MGRRTNPDIETIREKLIADPRTTQDICNLAGGLSASTMSLFRRRATTTLSYAAMQRLVPVLMPGHSVGIRKDATNTGCNGGGVDQAGAS